ncbi:hypothetical protein HU720_20380 [Pseudomonas sp. SWRI51]|uniref:NEL-type E3 ubiquitin ligase domain-containing protein n=1 Tax=Pseudomonas sp. SWRI51 TaxID=2745491 RepID=UPI0016473E9C|nr:hypothetical protein [Pseudomonas sp. SWRI51]
MPDIPIPVDSIDALIADRLPRWLAHPNQDRLSALHSAMRAQQAHGVVVSQLFADLPTLDDYATPKLVQALSDAGLDALDVRACQVRIARIVELPTAAPNLPPPRHTFHSRQSLLGAALHNFHREETRPSVLRRGRLVDVNGQLLGLGFEVFAGLCRKLDIGAGYQALLKERFLPGEEGSAERQMVEQAVQENLRLHLELAVRIALLKGELDEQSYLQLLAVFSARPVVPATPGELTARQLYLLGKEVCGVATLEVRSADGLTLEAVLLWVAKDPHRPVSRHASWQAVYTSLAERLRERDYQDFFARFIKERDRGAFFSTLKRLLRGVPPGQAVELDGRHLPVAGSLLAHLRGLQLSKLLDDAQVLAVPTGMEDEADRRERLQAQFAAGFDLLGLAGMFVPVLGELMLVVSAVELGEQLYEGYQDWQLGDRQGALDHLFSVAQSLALGVVVGGVSGAAVQLARVPFVDALEPVRTRAGVVRLADGQLRGYAVADQGIAVGHQALLDGQWHLRLQQGTFRLSSDGDNWLIRHPQRQDAHTPWLEHNGVGSWRHQFESAQQWRGAGQLLRRLHRRLAAVSDADAQVLLDTTAFDEARVRQLHLENADAPARLLDAYERYQLHLEYPALRGAAFDSYLAEREVVPSAAAGLLRRDFTGLSVRCAEEILAGASSAQVETMLATQRVPLELAEQARWQLRDSRLDRACAGLRLAQAVNEDSERLVLGLIDRLAPWPDSMRIELRQDTLDGPLLAAHGAEAADEVRSIVRGPTGYRLGAEAGGVSAQGSLMGAVWQSLDEAQKGMLGNAQLSSQGLADVLVANAASERPLVAELIGMAPIGRGLRPPVRLGDGRVGYMLSGRGVGGRAAVRRGMHQLFPTMTDLQMEAYVLDLLHRRVDLWAHFNRLQLQIDALRQGLRSWRDATRNPLELLSRQRVVQAIRRSWRRKVVDAGGDYVLSIDGERVGHLPALPTGLDFVHVRRLILRNMGLASLDADFLGRFTGLVELDLSHNQLSALPAGLELLTSLRRLLLSSNRIALDAAGNARLTALTRLHTLDLSRNPLGQPPALSELRHLRRLGLRATGLENLPEPADQLSWRGIADLRDNSIRRVRGDLGNLRLRIERLSLHDNPLQASSEQLLDQAAGVSQQRRLHHSRSDDPLNPWLVSRSSEQGQRREALWQNVQAQDGSADLFRFLDDFTQTDDFEENPDYYRARVWHILEAAEQHLPLRVRLFREAGGVRTCDDRLLLILSQLELSVLAEQALFDGPSAQVEQRLVRLGRALWRLDEVDAFAARHVQQMRQQAGSAVDEIETRLFYRVRLARVLALPAQPAEMHYESFASVTTSDLKRAQAAVLQNETDEVLISSLAQRPFWQNYVRDRHAQRFETLAEPFHLRLEDFERGAGEGGEQHYLEQCNALMVELEEAERVLTRDLAREAVGRAGH